MMTVLNSILGIAEFTSVITAFVETIRGDIARATFFYAVAIYCHLARKDD